MSVFAESFRAKHNLSAYPSVARMRIKELREWYEAVAYSPTTGSITDDVTELHQVQSNTTANLVRQYAGLT